MMFFLRIPMNAYVHTSTSIAVNEKAHVHGHLCTTNVAHVDLQGLVFAYVYAFVHVYIGVCTYVHVQLAVFFNDVDVYI